VRVSPWVRKRPLSWEKRQKKKISFRTSSHFIEKNNEEIDEGGLRALVRDFFWKRGGGRTREIFGVTAGRKQKA